MKGGFQMLNLALLEIEQDRFFFEKHRQKKWFLVIDWAMHRIEIYYDRPGAFEEYESEKEPDIWKRTKSSAVIGPFEDFTAAVSYAYLIKRKMLHRFDEDFSIALPSREQFSGK